MSIRSNVRGSICLQKAPFCHIFPKGRGRPAPSHVPWCCADKPFVAASSRTLHLIGCQHSFRTSGPLPVAMPSSHHTSSYTSLSSTSTGGSSSSSRSRSSKTSRHSNARPPQLVTQQIYNAYVKKEVLDEFLTRTFGRHFKIQVRHSSPLTQWCETHGQY